MSKGEMLPNGHGPIGPTKPVAANPGANAKPVRPQRRHSAKQLYRRYVNKSNLFAQSGQQSNHQLTGRWQSAGQNGAPFRYFYCFYPYPMPFSLQIIRFGTNRQTIAMANPKTCKCSSIGHEHLRWLAWTQNCATPCRNACLFAALPTGVERKAGGGHGKIGTREVIGLVIVDFTFRGGCNLG